MSIRLLTILSALTLLSAALAHAELKGSSVEDGATVREPPSEIRLRFSEPLQVRFSTFKVYPLPVAAIEDEDQIGAAHAADEAGKHEHLHDDEEQSEARAQNEAHPALDEAARALVMEVLPLTDDAEARVDTGVTPGEGSSAKVTLQLQARLPEGDYVVMWRALSADGHVLEDFLTFTYQPSGN
jgi:methionine-rich copper-binding protein CopC